MIDLIKKLFARYRRLIVYGVVGCINTAADYLIFSLLYYLVGVPVELSQTAGFLTGTVVSYLLNSNITFKEGKGRTRAQFIQHICVDVLLTASTSWFMGWAEKHIPIPVLFVKIGVTIAVALIHYTIYKYVIFRIKKEDGR